MESHKAGDEPDDDKSKANDGPGEVSDKAAANDPQVRPLLEDGNYSKDLELTHKFDKVELEKVAVTSSHDLGKKETAVENLSALELDTCSNSAINYLGDDVGTLTDKNLDLQKKKLKPVRVEDAEKLVKKLKLDQYMECSSFNKQGLSDVFNEAICIALDPPKKKTTTCFGKCTIS